VTRRAKRNRACLRARLIRRFYGRGGITRPLRPDEETLLLGSEIVAHIEEMIFEGYADERAPDGTWQRRLLTPAEKDAPVEWEGLRLVSFSPSSDITVDTTLQLRADGPQAVHLHVNRQEE
jgi:hypothetical protein